MRSRRKPVGAAPSTKYGALPMRSSRHSIDSASAADRGAPAVRGRVGDARDERLVEPDGLARPARVQPVAEIARAVWCRARRRAVGRSRSSSSRTAAYSAACSVGRDLAEPVGAAAAVAAGEQPVEQVMRRRVHDDARQVLAADEIDVVDPQVGGHDLVAGRAVRALPLDDQRDAVAQAVARGEEGARRSSGRR